MTPAELLVPPLAPALIVLATVSVLRSVFSLLA